MSHMSHISNVRKMNEIDRLNLIEEFSSYIETLNLNKDEKNEIKIMLDMISGKKRNPEIIKNNKQSLRDHLKNIVNEKKKISKTKKKES